MNTLDSYSAILYKAENFIYFLCLSSSTRRIARKGSTLKGKNLLSVGANFSIRVDPFSKETKKVLTQLPPQKVYSFAR